MSAKPIAPDSGLQQLIDEGYEVEVRQQHLLIHSVPYVNSRPEIAVGTLVCKYVENAGSILAPNSQGDNHQVWWVGEFPCRADGALLTDLTANTATNRIEILNGLIAQHQFSNKPEEFFASGFPDHYRKIEHYVTLIQSQARVLDGSVDARTRRIISPADVASVFRYADTASVRAEIVATAARLKIDKVAIIGLGGTGAYILDQVAKTPVQEIHLFDGDEFKQHNAFRAPGAATIDDLKQHWKKVGYFKRKYAVMRSGIVTHPNYLDETNVTDLAGFNFVFVCVDKGNARRTICRYLAEERIPFVDVGMDVAVDPDTGELDGTCRVTTATADRSRHIGLYVPMDDDDADALYRQNIQIADLNALNAMFAVIRWKQQFGFYRDRFLPLQQTYTVSTQSLTRDSGDSV